MKKILVLLTLSLYTGTQYSLDITDLLNQEYEEYNASEEFKHLDFENFDLTKLNEYFQEKSIVSNNKNESVKKNNKRKRSLFKSIKAEKKIDILRKVSASQFPSISIELEYQYSQLSSDKQNRYWCACPETHCGFLSQLKKDLDDTQRKMQVHILTQHHWQAFIKALEKYTLGSQINKKLDTFIKLKKQKEMKCPIEACAFIAQSKKIASEHLLDHIEYRKKESEITSSKNLLVNQSKYKKKTAYFSRCVSQGKLNILNNINTENLNSSFICIQLPYTDLKISQSQADKNIYFISCAECNYQEQLAHNPDTTKCNMLAHILQKHHWHKFIEEVMEQKSSLKLIIAINKFIDGKTNCPIDDNCSFKTYLTEYAYIHLINHIKFQKAETAQ